MQQKESANARGPTRAWLGLALVLLPLLALISCSLWTSRKDAIKRHNLEAAQMLQFHDIHSDKNHFGLQVLGDAQYRLQIARALHLLSLSDPESLAFVTNNIRIIIDSEHSGIWLLGNTPVFSLSRTSAFHSITWCAGTMVHDANHSFMDRHSVNARKASSTERSFRELQAVELECIRRQLVTLKRIGAPKYQIDYLRSSDGTYFDVNGDGRYDWSDFHNRRW